MRMARVPALMCAFMVLSAPASAAVRITKIYFDSPGSDTGSNPSLNAERVVLRNNGSQGVHLTNWTLRDAAGHVYKFGSFTLGGGKSVTVHTGDGSNTQQHRYWGQEWYVWNNDGDTATLKRPNGTKVDQCSYSGSGSSVSC